MQRILIALSQYISVNYPEKLVKYFQIKFVFGYPKSGTTWLSEALGLYFNVPRPSHSLLPVTFASIIQTHTGPKNLARKGLMITRHPFDVYWSWFNESKHRHKKGLHFSDKKILIESLRFETISEQFLFFFRQKLMLKWNWFTYHEAWLESDCLNNSIHTIKYEVMREDFTQLGNVIERAGYDVDLVLLLEVDELMKLYNRSEKTHRVFYNGGVKNGWSKHVSCKDLYDLLSKQHKQIMIKMGYEN